MTLRKHTRLDTIVNLIKMRNVSGDLAERAMLLDTIAEEMAKTLKAYCNQQGNGCERCVFRLPDSERQNCECRINIGKNELGTAPRFWELMEKRDHEDKERIDTDGQLGKVLPVREKSE